MFFLYCRAHFDARPNHARNFIQPLSGIHDFVRSVQLVARMIFPYERFLFVQQVARYGEIPPRCVIDDFVLKGKMFLYSLFACLIFMKKLDGKYIKLVDVEEGNNALRDYYRQFGFIEDGCQDLIISLDALEEHLREKE